MGSEPEFADSLFVGDATTLYRPNAASSNDSPPKMLKIVAHQRPDRVCPVGNASRVNVS